MADDKKQEGFRYTARNGKEFYVPANLNISPYNEDGSVSQELRNYIQNQSEENKDIPAMTISRARGPQYTLENEYYSEENKLQRQILEDENPTAPVITSIVREIANITETTGRGLESLTRLNVDPSSFAPESAFLFPTDKSRELPETLTLEERERANAEASRKTAELYAAIVPDFI